MLEGIRSTATTPFSPADMAGQKPVPASPVSGTERPDANQPGQAVAAAHKSAEAKTDTRHGPDAGGHHPPSKPDKASADTAESKASTGDVDGEDTSKDSGEAQTTEEALKDPNSEVSQQVRELSARDLEVRAHEQAHLAAAGQYSTYGPNYSYQTGPDGRRYAIGGEVGIDTSVVADDPQATLAKMQVVQRAAMAPAEPSAQDMRVASDAAQKAAQARMDIARSQFESRSAEPSDDTDETDTVSETSTKTQQDNQSRNAIDAYAATEQANGELLDVAA